MLTIEVVMYILNCSKCNVTQKDFEAFIKNQTVAMFNGEVLYYLDDVKRFIALQIKKELNPAGVRSAMWKEV